MDSIIQIPMPRPRNPAVDRMTFDALVKRVEDLERKAEVKRGRPRKEDESESND